MHLPLVRPLRRAVVQVSFAIISNRIPFVNTFFHIFSFFLPVLSNPAGRCFVPFFPPFSLSFPMWWGFGFCILYVGLSPLFLWLGLYVGGGRWKMMIVYGKILRLVLLRCQCKFFIFIPSVAHATPPLESFKGRHDRLWILDAGF